MQGQMLRPESASLAAAFSRDTDARRQAIVTLHPLFCILLARLIGNGALVGKLMRRHYLPLQERDAKWELHALAEEFKVGRERVARAAQAVDRYARQIEADALASLGELLNPIPVPPTPQPQQEAVHA
jgi:hypothetical protein